MRKHLGGTYLATTILGLAMTMTASSASAALLASDNASNAPYNDGWQAGDNGGTGWGGGWTFRNGGNTVVTPGGSFFGTFVASSLLNNSPSGSDSNADGDINTAGNKAWGMYANTSNELYAVRPFNGTLSVGQSVWFEFDNGNVDSTRVLGVRLLANASDINTRQIEARFVGGDSFYTVVATPNVTSALGFSREGISVEFTLTSTTTYSLELTRLQSGQKQTITGSLIAPGGNLNINAIAFRNLAAGSGGAFDGYFNSIAVVPEPTTLLATALTPLLLTRRPRRV